MDRWRSIPIYLLIMASQVPFIDFHDPYIWIPIGFGSTFGILVATIVLMIVDP